ncbi:MAG TPA: transcriptional regulator, partial [Candidatus Dormibacteraeota bacterium]|nr:transcriptional regulator [Candidatus Dormibacteraeota bacterium]
LEALARLAPPRRATSLREGTRAEARRRGRLCYDHLAGRLGIAVLQGFLDRGALVRLDGRATPARRAGDRLAAPVRQGPYAPGPHLEAVAAALDLDLAELGRRRRPLLSCCVDWSEQGHHLAGALGAAVAERLLGQGWVRRGAVPRSVAVTELGADALLQHLGVHWEIRPAPVGGFG